MPPSSGASSAPKLGATAREQCKGGFRQGRTSARRLVTGALPRCLLAAALPQASHHPALVAGCCSSVAGVFVIIEKLLWLSQ